MHKSKNIVHINTKAKRSQTSCFQEVWPFYSLTSVKDGILIPKIVNCLHNIRLSKWTYSGINRQLKPNINARRVFDTLFSP